MANPPESEDRPTADDDSRAGAGVLATEAEGRAREPDEREPSHRARPTQPLRRKRTDPVHPIAAAAPPRAGARSRLPWAWLLLLLLVCAVAVVVGLDLYHRGRYELVCRDGRLELRRGRRLPLPVGTETLGGLYRPLALPPGAACPEDQILDGALAARAAYLDFILTQVAHALADPGAGLLKDLRLQLLQALEITRDPAHRARRGEVEDLLADLSYREGRANLSRIEADLRAALARLRDTRRLAPGRYADLGAWVDHLERLLASVALGPRVTSAPPRAPAPLPPERGASPPAPADSVPESVPPDAKPSPPSPAAPAEAPLPAPEAAPREPEGDPPKSGILM